MGCGASTLDPEERGPPSLNQPLPAKNDLLTSAYNNKNGGEEETDSLGGSEGKSTSSAKKESRFVRMVVGSNDKKRGVDTEMEQMHDDKKSASSQKKNGVPAAGSNVQEDDVKNVGSMNTEERNFRETKPGKKGGAMDNDNVHASYGERGAREDSIALSPGSPSFRDYCVVNDQGMGSREDNGEKVKESISLRESEGSQDLPSKRERMSRRLRAVMHKGRSAAGMRIILNFSRRNSSARSD